MLCGIPSKPVGDFFYNVKNIFPFFGCFFLFTFTFIFRVVVAVSAFLDSIREEFFLLRL